MDIYCCLTPMKVSEDLFITSLSSLNLILAGIKKYLKIAKRTLIMIFTKFYESNIMFYRIICNILIKNLLDFVMLYNVYKILLVLFNLYIIICTEFNEIEFATLL